MRRLSSSITSGRKRSRKGPIARHNLWPGTTLSGGRAPSFTEVRKAHRDAIVASKQPRSSFRTPLLPLPLRVPFLRAMVNADVRLVSDDEWRKGHPSDWFLVVRDTPFKTVKTLSEKEKEKEKEKDQKANHVSETNKRVKPKPQPTVLEQQLSQIVAVLSQLTQDQQDRLLQVMLEKVKEEASVEDALSQQASSYLQGLRRLMRACADSGRWDWVQQVAQLQLGRGRLPFQQALVEEALELFSKEPTMLSSAYTVFSKFPQPSSRMLTRLFQAIGGSLTASAASPTTNLEGNSKSKHFSESFKTKGLKAMTDLLLFHAKRTPPMSLNVYSIVMEHLLQQGQHETLSLLTSRLLRSPDYSGRLSASVMSLMIRNCNSMKELEELWQETFVLRDATLTQSRWSSSLVQQTLLRHLLTIHHHSPPSPQRLSSTIYINAVGQTYVWLNRLERNDIRISCDALVEWIFAIHQHVFSSDANPSLSSSFPPRFHAVFAAIHKLQATLEEQHSQTVPCRLAWLTHRLLHDVASYPKTNPNDAQLASKAFERLKEELLPMMPAMKDSPRLKKSLLEFSLLMGDLRTLQELASSSSLKQKDENDRWPKLIEWKLFKHCNRPSQMTTLSRRTQLQLINWWISQRSLGKLHPIVASPSLFCTVLKLIEAPNELLQIDNEFSSIMKLSPSIPSQSVPSSVQHNIISSLAYRLLVTDTTEEDDTVSWGEMEKNVISLQHRLYPWRTSRESQRRAAHFVEEWKDIFRQYREENTMQIPMADAEQEHASKKESRLPQQAMAA